MFIILLLLSYLGLIIGALISSKAKEELKTGKPYFILLRFIVLLAIIILFLLNLKLNYTYVVMISLFSIILFFYLNRSLKMINPEMFTYSLFSVVLIDSLNTKFNPVIAVLIFLYGMLLSGEKYDVKKGFIKNSASLITNNILYILVGLALFFFRA